MISEGNESKITKVAVAVDFSEHSADAMDVGIAAAASIAEIVCLQVYNVPSGYYKTGKSYEQFVEVIIKCGAELSKIHRSI